MDIQLQANALSAACRLLFGFRLSMTTLATPFALTATRDRPTAWLTGAAVLVTVMVSYALLRDWDRFGPVLLRHPALLGMDMLFGALLLFAASPNSTLAYVSICTPLLAGLVYGPRGAAFYAVLQILLIAAAYAAHSSGPDSTPLLVAGLCAIAAAAGTSLRRLLLRLTTASQALNEAHARLAVADERARMAREMHDSVAKTLHGLALAADALAHTATRSDPTLRTTADLVASSARQAAAESRLLLDDLRTPAPPSDLPTALRAAATTFTARTGLPVRVDVVTCEGGCGGCSSPRPGAVQPQSSHPAAEAEELQPGEGVPPARAKPRPWGKLRPPGEARYPRRSREQGGLRGGTPPRRPEGLGEGAGGGATTGRRPERRAPGADPFTAPPTTAHRTPAGDDLTTTLLAIANEAWDNTHRHAGATAITVTVAVRPDHLHVTFRDNGRGLPADALRRRGHYGLLGITERAARLNATLDIRPPGAEIRLTVPMEDPCPA
ncbi:sensor histidine kinase [Streptomyces sp. NPDC060194]|uniref:sensor histidine kinase n=1 Tax=Streptomyces sp. NPDC060194 TaxID=3347069 RepID=UPI003666E39A